MKILVTGAAGFIGMHTCEALLKRGDKVLGIDSLSDYYDIRLKKDRIKKLKTYKNFSFIKLDIASDNFYKKISKFRSTKIIHLAAQAGVRHSLKNPADYIHNNISGFLNILEAAVKLKVKHLTYASSSSVYGNNSHNKLSELHSVDHPISFYAVSKKTNELMAHSFSHLYKLPTSGLRFFTVYGPWGRPDMAGIIFIKKIIDNKKIDVFNHGKMIRDFTYIDDIVSGILKINDKIATPSSAYNPFSPTPNISSAPFRIFNLGNSNPVNLLDFIKEIEKNLGQKAKINYMPIQKGDVKRTSADISLANKWIKFKPNIKINEGVKNLVTWYKDYYLKNG